jgi:hypothetical protein
METWQCVYAEAAADGDLGQEIFWDILIETITILRVVTNAVTIRVFQDLPL